MEKCTWVNCEEEAQIPIESVFGEEWANLCDRHARKIEAAMADSDVKRLARYWVRAQGGAKIAAKRFHR